MRLSRWELQSRKHRVPRIRWHCSIQTEGLTCQTTLVLSFTFDQNVWIKPTCSLQPQNHFVWRTEI